MQALPEIRGRDSQGVLNLIRAQSIELAEKECVGEPLRQFRHATAEHLPELFRLHLAARVASPRGRACSPVTSRVKGFRFRAGSVLRDTVQPGRLSCRFSDLVNDLVPEDPDEPGSLARSPRIRFSGAQGLQESLLDDVRSPIRHTQSQERVAIQAVAVPVYPALGVDLLNVIHWPMSVARPPHPEIIRIGRSRTEIPDKQTSLTRAPTRRRRCRTIRLPMLGLCQSR